MAVAEDEDVRPLTDWPKVVSASIVPYEIDIDLTIYTGPDETVVLAAAQQAVEAYRAGARKLGRSITRAGLFGAAMVSGVHNAVINQPPAMCRSPASRWARAWAWRCGLPAMSTDSLLPPNATPLETGLARLGQRLSAVELPIADLWNPQTCPLPALPWLAWTLSVDTWDTDWTEERKRAITAGAIAAQRRKGSVAVVREALRTIDERLELVEADPAVSPCLYRAPAGAGPRGRAGVTGGGAVPVATASQIVAALSRAAPVRSQLNLVIELDLAARVVAEGAARAALYRRMRAGPDATGINWAGLLTNEMGEPLADDSGQFIDGSG
jgi:phage tail P2-like protein